MAIIRTVAALLLTIPFAASAVAQEAATSEFGRASGGELAIGVKRPSQLSGSLSFALPFASNGGRRGGATFGGTVVQDRLWFFAAAEQMQQPLFSTATGSSFVTNANAHAQLGDRQSLGAMFGAGRQPVLAPSSSAPSLSVPSSFLSLHYTGVVSSNMFFTATVARSSRQDQ